MMSKLRFPAFLKLKHAQFRDGILTLRFAIGGYADVRITSTEVVNNMMIGHIEITRHSFWLVQFQARALAFVLRPFINLGKVQVVF